MKKNKLIVTFAEAVDMWKVSKVCGLDVFRVKTRQIGFWYTTANEVEVAKFALRNAFPSCKFEAEGEIKPAQIIDVPAEEIESEESDDDAPTT